MRVFLSRLARNAAGLSRARPRGTAFAASIALIVTVGGSPPPPPRQAPRRPRLSAAPSSWPPSLKGLRFFRRSRMERGARYTYTWLRALIHGNILLREQGPLFRIAGRSPWLPDGTSGAATSPAREPPLPARITILNRVNWIRLIPIWRSPLFRLMCRDLISGTYRRATTIG
jgi:hypothetical protein